MTDPAPAAPAPPAGTRPETRHRIAPPDWMRDPAARRVIAALDGRARFVGGCVRNALLGRPVNDIDIATPLPPDSVMAALQSAGIKAIPTGIDHGTVTAVADHRPFEITTLRVDVETDGRHAVVAYTGDWQADAARRDFTMNTLSAEPDGTVHDYFGGLEDALAGRVRFVGDPAARLEEDVLRLLRFFRFHAHYGRTAPDPAALGACRAYAPRLARLSGERVRDELLKLLAAADPVPAWRLMIDNGVARHAVGEDGAMDRLAGLVRVEPAADPLRRLAALLTCDAAGAAALAGRLRLSNAQRDRLVAVKENAGAVTPGLDVRALRRLVYRLGRDLVADLLLLAWAEDPEDPRFRGLLDQARQWVPVRLPVRGRDAVTLGVPAGPAVGDLLRAVEAWWIDHDFRPGRDACLAELRRRIAGLDTGPTS